ncbi:MAG TPA: LLM class F420-dependent oxidoreductase [Candidatus Limnocylindrales bacterium]|nr:LLM class F420-dependent oxidoreductase [Candidatus Limnocylindrales bacterium]
MRPIRIAAQLHPQQGPWPALRGAGVEADELGYDLIYTWDHFFPLYGDPGGPHLECFSILAALAEATSHAELGPLVACIGYRNPNLLADMSRTIDHVSGGRMVLGLGAGWQRRDYDAYGYEFGTFPTRLADLARAMPVIEQRLAELNPPPLRRMPILIAGVGERVTLKLVARYADAWHASFPESPDELVPKVEALRRHCAAAGRNPADIEWGLGVEPDDLDRFLREDADRYVELGFTQFTLGFNGPRWDVGRGVDWLRWRDERNRERAA